MGQVVSKTKLKKILDREKQKGKKIVFTNGCFDILHLGHVKYLKKAKRFGDILILGLNTDSSVRVIKGKERPIIPERERAGIVASLIPVDYVVLFPELNPIKLINFLKPNILIKGADYDKHKILGRDVVEKEGGKVIRIPLEKRLGTSEIIKKIISRYRRVKK